DPTTGQCSNPTASNGTTCTGENTCSEAYACQAGTCTRSKPLRCTASDQCHGAGTCDPGTGQCSNPAAPQGTTCSDSNLCDRNPVCDGAGHCAGTLKTCTATDQCHAAGTCNPVTGQCSNPTAPNGTACSDNNPCTGGETCQAGSCTRPTTLSNVSFGP